MSFRKTLVLTLILIASLLYIFKVQIPTKEAFLKKDLVFKDLEASSIHAIEIDKGGSIIALANPQKSDVKTWELGGLSGSQLDQATVNTLLTTLRDLNPGDPLPKEDVDTDLTVYGLQKPELILKIKTQDSERKLLIGKNNQYLNKRYVKFDSNENIYLIADALYAAATKSRDEFRDKTPLDFIDTDLSEIILTRSTDQVKVDRVDSKVWNLKKPIEVPASSEHVADYTRALRNLKAKGFIDDLNLKKSLGLETPELIVKLVFNAQRKQAEEEILFTRSTTGQGNSKSEERYFLYQKNSPSIVELAANPFPLINKRAGDFREKKMLSFAKDKVKNAEVVLEDGSKILIKKEGNIWKVNAKDGDNIFVDQWLTNLSELMAVSFPEGNAVAGFEKPKYKLSLDIETPAGEAKISRNLTIGNETRIDTAGKVYFAATDDFKNPFLINEESYKKIVLKEEALLPQPVSSAASTAQPVQAVK